MDARLRTGLMRLGDLMETQSEPWWIIGSTAMVLAGIKSIVPDDIDVVGSSALLADMMTRAGAVAPETKSHAQFRSLPYGRIPVIGGTEIEVMGDLEVCISGQWQRLTLKSRCEVKVGGVCLYVPTLEEQMSVFRLFGRPKDISKAEQIHRHLSL
jgi:hypothetical protein